VITEREDQMELDDEDDGRAVEFSTSINH
jgi:hypothetical protein